MKDRQIWSARIYLLLPGTAGWNQSGRIVLPVPTGLTRMCPTLPQIVTRLCQTNLFSVRKGGSYPPPPVRPCYEKHRVRARVNRSGNSGVFVGAQLHLIVSRSSIRLNMPQCPIGLLSPIVHCPIGFLQKCYRTKYYSSSAKFL